MIPIRDNNPIRSTPVVTIVLIAINVVVYFYQLRLPANVEQVFVETWGAIPGHMVETLRLHTLVTSMFLHGGILHLAGNMLYLWIFGDNIEYILGHGRYLAFYILCGLAAAFAHIISAPTSMVPMVGASGAISGVLGAYALRFPGARVLVVVPIIIFFTSFYMPAILVLGFWFLMQLMSGIGSLGYSSGGGVAWFAHVGGFVAGMLLVSRFERRRVARWW